MPICISSTTTEQLYWVYIEPVYKGVKIGPVESAASGSWSSTSCKRCPPFPRVMLIRKWEQLRRKNLMKDEPILPSHFPVRGLRQECLTNSVITKPVRCLFQVYMSHATYAWLYFLWSQYWWGGGKYCEMGPRNSSLPEAKRPWCLTCLVWAVIYNLFKACAWF